MTAPPSSVFKIEPKGFMRVEFGDFPVEFDAVAIHTLWTTIDEGFRDEKGEFSRDKAHEANLAAREFVKDLIMGQAETDEQKGKALAVVEQLSMTNVFEFFARLREEVTRLTAFFEVKSPDASSSPGSSATTRFST